MKFFRDAWPIVVIVGTAWSVRDFMTVQIAASESRLAAQIAATETRLTAQITAADNRITTLDNRLTAQIAESETRLTGQIAEIRLLFVDHLEDHLNQR